MNPAINVCLDEEGFKFVWEIENYNFFYCERGEYLKSTEFYLDTIGPMHLELYPKGDVFDKDEYVTLYLNATRQKDFSIDCDIVFFTKLGQTSFAKQKSSSAPRWKFKKIEIPPTSTANDESFSISKGTLVVKCHFHQNRNLKEESSFAYDESSDLQILSNEIEKMCMNTQHSDFTLTYESKDFHLHKGIIYARVPKLAEELRMDECSKATIDDIAFYPAITSEVFKSFLIFIYSGKVPVLTTDVVRGLYKLSERYEMTNLKKKLRCYPNESISRTVVKVDRKSFTWSIKDVDKLDSASQEFYGPSFCSGTLPSSDLHFVAIFEEDKFGYYDLRLSINRLFPGIEQPIYVWLKVSVANFTGDSKYNYIGDHFFKEDAEWKLPTFFRMKKLGDKGMFRLLNAHILCLRGKNFRLAFEFYISGKELVSNILSTGSFLTPQTIAIQSSNDVRNFSTDLGKLYNIFLPKYSDVLLHVGDVRFPAHMVILSARSPVFSRMFQHEMLEKKMETVNIADIDVATLNLMLLYIYSGKIEMILNYDSALQLYAAADKYDITSLRNRCTVTLKNKLGDENVCSLLILADMHSDIKLKNHAKNYICKKSDIILKLPEWKYLLSNRPDLATEIIQVLMTHILNHKESCSMCSKQDTFC